MAEKKWHDLACVACLLMMAAASGLSALPFIASSFALPEAREQIDFQKLLEEFWQTCHLPGSPKLGGFVFAAWLLGAVGFTLFFWLTDNVTVGDKFNIDNFWKWTFFFQCFLWMICIFLAVSYSHRFRTPDDASNFEWKVLNVFIVPAIFVAADIVVFISGVLGYLVITALMDTIESQIIKIEERVLKKVAAVDDHQTIVINQNNQVELVTYQKVVKWRPWPVVLVKRNCEAIISCPDLIGSLAAPAEEKIIRQIKTDLELENWAVLISQVQQTTVPDILLFLSQRFERLAETCIEKVIETRAPQSFATATGVLQTISSRALGRFRKDLAAGVVDKAKEELEPLFAQASKEIVKFFNGEQTEERLALLPEGTRFCFSRGGFSVVVIEQPPQVRTVYFSQDFLDEELKKLKEDATIIHRDAPATNLRLAFPYLVFVIVSYDDRLEGLYLFYNKKPLNSLQDPIFRPNLPNVGHDYHVCLSLIKIFKKGTSLKERTEEVLDCFWDSHFNNHLIEVQYELMKCEPRLRTIWHWQEQSAQDPLFVLNVNWLPTTKTIGTIVENCFKSSEFHALARFKKFLYPAMTACQTELGDKMAKFFDQINVEDRYDKIVVEFFSQYLGNLVKAISDQVLENAKTIANHLNPQTIEDFNAALKTALIEALEQYLKERRDRLAEVGGAASYLEMARLVKEKR